MKNKSISKYQNLSTIQTPWIVFDSESSLIQTPLGVHFYCEFKHIMCIRLSFGELYTPQFRVENILRGTGLCSLLFSSQSQVKSEIWNRLHLWHSLSGIVVYWLILIVNLVYSNKSINTCHGLTREQLLITACISL